MERKKIIKKILVLAAWFLVICGMTTLLVAANRKEKDQICRDVLIGIKAAGDKLYIEKEDVLHQIEQTTGGSLLQRPLTKIDLHQLEKQLELNPWILNAELYFDSKDELHVSIEEREPLARIFTTDGDSFYIDSSGHKMPLLEKMSARVPVVTGFTSDRKWNTADSNMMAGVKEVAGFIYNHQFWNEQIGQIDITNEKKFELIPVIGNHIIRLGSAENVAGKLNRLYIFYQQVLSKVGFDKYAALDIQYDGQVVAIKKGESSAVDSLQLQKNIEELMNRTNLETVDEEMLPQTNSITELKIDSTGSDQNHSGSARTNPNPLAIKDSMNQTGSNAAKKTNQSKPSEKLKPLQKANEKKPKAVMKKLG